ncbi:2-nitropropane dioxygenase [Kosmotoga arenicorallina S304]|uniref:2-nitropropane dioxygenase n=2 Tax=Kosmotoga arenicorallina TaxID=688066 RepID=A0A176JZE2_9BACT|nr:enoyl-[acyl-carrier-protein] reductase FabK [Kosmotoga arenicorallina]OAA29445.1 2-nitropropane dioxygenase [Kosmotoga arenicorallina S304]
MYPGKRVSGLLGIKYPILQGGMAWVATAELASAVSNAGGLGIIAAGNLTPNDLKAEITKAKAFTDKPFGVNLMLLSPHIEEQVRILCEERIPVVTTGAGNPGKYINRFKEAGIKVIPVVASPGLAKRVEKLGADAVIAEGMEAGGHIGKLTTMVLVPQTVDAVSIPVIAAGGIADARGAAAAFSLGAEGIQIGTLFACSLESTAHENFKKRILSASSLDAVVTGESTGHPVRSLRNSLTKKLLELESREASFEEFEKLAVGGLKRAVKEGDTKTGSVMAGQVAGLVKEIKPVKEIIEEIFKGVDEIFQKFAEMGVEK